MGSPLPAWNGTIAHARELQVEFAKRVVLRDGFNKPLRTVAGFVAAPEDDGTRTCAAAVLIDADSLDLIDAQVAHVANTTAFVPGLLSFHVMPALLRVLGMLVSPPDLAMVDGHGIAHPQRFGIAAHFGLAADLPTIGIAPKPLLGTAAALHQVRGAYTPLREHGQQIGWLLRSKPEVAPIVVSPGHRVAMASAADLCMRFTQSEREPEPVHMAQRLAARRGNEDDADADDAGDAA
jgi:deoxyribonuclease V